MSLVHRIELWQKEDMNMHAKFSKLAHKAADMMGSSKTFALALLVILAWLVSGPIFHYSDTWQLIINTGTTIVTFLMVILIQHTQNHDSRAFHLKLDELIRAMKQARNSLVDLESLSDEELDRLHKDFQRIREEASDRKGPAPR